MRASEKAWQTTRENRRLRNGMGKEYAIAQLQEIVLEWLWYYVDERGRTWREMGEPWKDYTFDWKNAKRMLDDRGITYVEGDLAEAIKRAMAALRAAPMELDTPPAIASVTSEVVQKHMTQEPR